MKREDERRKKNRINALAAKRGLLNPSPPPQDHQASTTDFIPAKPKPKMQLMNSSSAMSMMAPY